MDSLKDFPAYLKVSQQLLNRFDSFRSLSEKTERFSPMEKVQSEKVEEEIAISE